MPRLDLLSEQDLNFGGVLLLDQWEDGCVDCVEHLGGVGTNIVEIKLQGVQSGGVCGRELLTGEFRCERHFE